MSTQHCITVLSRTLTYHIDNNLHATQAFLYELRKFLGSIVDGK